MFGADCFLDMYWIARVLAGLSWMARGKSSF